MTNPTTKDLIIHLTAEIWASPGQIHLAASPSDYKELQEFFSLHFDTFSFTHDENGFTDRVFKCPAGSMFLRDDKGELVRKDD